MSQPISRRQCLLGFVAGLFGLRAGRAAAAATPARPAAAHPAPTGLTRIYDPAFQITTFVYDADAHRAPSDDLAPRTICVYDAAGRVVSVAQVEGPERAG